MAEAVTTTKLSSNLLLSHCCGRQLKWPSLLQIAEGGYFSSGNPMGGFATLWGQGTSSLLLNGQWHLCTPPHWRCENLMRVRLAAKTIQWAFCSTTNGFSARELLPPCDQDKSSHSNFSVSLDSLLQRYSGSASFSSPTLPEVPRICLVRRTLFSGF